MNAPTRPKTIAVAETVCVAADVLRLAQNLILMPV